MKHLRIKVDVGDGDYLYSCDALNDEAYELVKPVIAALKTLNLKDNWKNIGEIVLNGTLNVKQVERFEEYLPSLEGRSIHTINRIELIEVDEIKRIL